METKEGNRIIAEFMGILLDPLIKTKTSVHFGSKTLQYHTSWDWLMPVVEKIESLIWEYEYISISRNRCVIVGGHNRKIIDQSRETKIQATYQSVLAFINWYNTTTPPNRI